MASSKNKLQEYFQRYSLTLPTYESNKLDGDWVSTVKFTYNGDDYEFKGNSSLRKKQAECNAAKEALETVGDSLRAKSETVEKPITEIRVGEILVPHTTSDRYTYVLVDYENINKISALNALDRNTKNLTILRFVSHLHVKATTDEANCVIDSSIKDAVDHYISFYVGGLCNKIPSTSPLYIFILTRDHFASSIPTFVAAYSNVTVKHCGTEKKCIEELRHLGITSTNHSNSATDSRNMMAAQPLSGGDA